MRFVGASGHWAPLAVHLRDKAHQTTEAYPVTILNNLSADIEIESETGQGEVHPGTES
jgi:hypothetical protein